ncbi:hypothetical protein KQI36_13615 [Clostridium senegalense]|uniref:hypothetical protein n=1 Tax=Clostridium senegalense TaxID=1465809 RepID=UPI001C10EBAB|nr:hypothetical protein [Clostridium senegalense]MBU5227671.1 hypothetical protein [Clostridium senegalense]
MSIPKNILLISRKASEITDLLYEKMCAKTEEDKNKISKKIEIAKKDLETIKNKRG